MRSEKGSITLFVLIAMIFFLALAMSAYVSASNKLQGQNGELEQIKAGYEQDISEAGLSSLYDNLTAFNKTLESQITALNYGDFVDYGVNIDNDDEEHINGWKIFYKDNQSNVFIIAADYVRNDNNILKEAISTSKANIATVSGTSYNVYWPNDDYLTKKNESGVAKIDSNIASKFMFGWLASNQQSTNPTAVTTASLLDKDAWSGFASGVAGAEAIGGPTLEMLRASWNEKTYSTGSHTKLQIASNSNGYYIDKNDNETIIPTTTNVDMGSDIAHWGEETLYFPHKEKTTLGAYDWCDGYWLASPSALDNKIQMHMYYTGYITGNYYNTTTDCGLRPVVCLPSNIMAKQDSNGVWHLEEGK